MDIGAWWQLLVEGLNPAWALPIILFTVAFLGGFAHCTMMCGPFVMLQQMKRMEHTSMEKMTELTRLKGALLLPYHLGRLTTYTFLGVLSYFLGVFLTKGSMMPVMVWFMLLAGILILLSLFKIPFLPKFSLPKPITKALKPFSEKPLGWRGYVYGLVLGFLPCGMLYGAFAATAGAESLYIAVLSMVAFSLGTMPGLFLIGILSQLGGDLLIKRIKIFARFGLGLAGLWLIVFAVSKWDHMHPTTAGHMHHQEMQKQHKESQEDMMLHHHH